MTGQPLNPQDNENDISEILDVKPRDAKPKNAFFSGLNFKSNKVPKVQKPVMPKPTLDKAAASKVPLSRPAGKRLPKEPGQVRPERKAGLALATTAQQRKLIPMVGVFLLLGAVSLYINFGNASTEKPVTAFMGPGPGQPGYIPAPGALNTTAGTSTPAGTTPGSAAAGFMPAATTPGAATGMPVVTRTSPGTSTNGAPVVSSANGAPVVSSAPPPVPGTATGAAGTAGTANTRTAAGTTTPGTTTPASKPTANKPGNSQPTTATKTTAAAATVPGAPGKAAPSPTDVPTEPVIPDVFSPADGKNGATASTGGNGRSANANSGNASGVVVTAQPASLGNVPLAAPPRQVQIAQAAPLSIQSLPAPAPTPVRTVPTLSAVPVALPRIVSQVPPPVVQSLPLAAPITARAPSGVTLTRGGVAVTSAPVTATPAAPAPSVVLVGTASGDTPTAILATPDGQIIAGIGDHVTVNNLDYTISTIAPTKVTLSHLKDTLTLTETN